MRNLTKTVLAAGTAALMMAAISGPAQAIPALQLYIEGSSYDAGTETWVTTAGTRPAVLPRAPARSQIGAAC